MNSIKPTTLNNLFSIAAKISIAASIFLIASMAAAQNFPNKTIKILTYAKKVLDTKYHKSIKIGIKKIHKNLYKKIIRKKNLQLSQKIIEYIKYRLLCYSIKFYEMKKSYAKR